MDSRPRRAAPDRLPDRYYWRRRAVVLVALVVVIAVVVAVVAAIRGRASTATPASSSSAPVVETSATPSPTPTVTPTPSPSGTPGVTSAAPTSAAAPTECVPNLLSLSVSGPRTVAATAKADLQVTLTNTGQAACVLVFDARFVLRVVSGSDEIWSTADCAAWMATGSQTVQPGAAATWKTTWDRHRSQKECKVVPTALKAGTYVANATYTGAVPAIWPMTLTG